MNILAAVGATAALTGAWWLAATLAEWWRGLTAIDLHDIDDEGDDW